ncbi:MAG: hypothetical protein NVSMB32_07640 [Actinomycetota bacterium]
MRTELREAIRRLLVSGYGEPAPRVDDSYPAAAGGFDDTMAIPPRRLVSASARQWPSADAVVSAMLGYLGIGEEPPGSNCNAITAWYGQGCVPWSVIALSKACCDAGFRDDAGQWNMPEVRPRSGHGFAWAADLRQAFQAAGRFDSSPRRGDIAILKDDRHACLVESVGADGILRTIEADFHDDCLRNARSAHSVAGFCHLPSWGLPPWPGRYLELGSQGDDVRTIQNRLAQRGWPLPVDGEYGPATQRVIDAFQQEKNLDNDGIVGPQTWLAAWQAPLT